MTCGSLLSLARKFKKSTLIEKIAAIHNVRVSLQHPHDKVPYTLPQIREFAAPDEPMIRKCTSDFALPTKKFVSAYLRLAPWVHYLRQKDSEDFKVLKKREILSDSIVRKFRHLAPLFPMALPPKVIMHESLLSPALLNEMPNFHPNLPPNPWGKILAALSQILALNHFDSVLQNIRAWGCPIPEHKEEAAAFRKWLDRCGKEAKINWHQLHAAVLASPTQDLSNALISFAIRLATVLVRNEAMALWSLGQAREDLLIDLERWLFSNT